MQTSAPTKVRRRQSWFVITTLAVAGAAACGGSGSSASDASRPSANSRTSATPNPTTTEASVGAGPVVAFERVVSGSEDPDLYAVPAGGGTAVLVRHQSGNPHWSPDGKTLAFLTCLNPPDCTTAVALLDRATGRVHGFSMRDPDLYTPCAIWAPSGGTLACEGTSDTHPTRNGIYTIRVSDGKALTRITRNPRGTDSPLAYSPDGAQLLISRSDNTRSSSANQALFVVTLAGGRAARITPWGYSDDSAGWSADGHTIVFGTNGSLYHVTRSGRDFGKIRLAGSAAGSPDANMFDVSFSPDGRRIVFSMRSGRAQAVGLYTALPDGSDVTQLTTSPTEDHHAAWGAAAR